jgi:hypothetical protein
LRCCPPAVTCTRAVTTLTSASFLYPVHVCALAAWFHVLFLLGQDAMRSDFGSTAWLLLRFCATVLNVTALMQHTAVGCHPGCCLHCWIVQCSAIHSFGMEHVSCVTAVECGGWQQLCVLLPCCRCSVQGIMGGVACFCYFGVRCTISCLLRGL